LILSDRKWLRDTLYQDAEFCLALRLSVTAEAKATVPAEELLQQRRHQVRQIDYGGERDEAKLHHLYPRRQNHTTGEGSRGGLSTGCRRQSEREGAEERGGGLRWSARGAMAELRRRQAGESTVPVVYEPRSAAPVVPPKASGGEEWRTRGGRESTNRAPQARRWCEHGVVPVAIVPPSLVDLDLLEHAPLRIGDGGGRVAAKRGEQPQVRVTPEFPKKTKCIPICMPGSSFMHIVT
jgi:hypothetical protein